jgi:hypothetical protein
VTPITVVILKTLLKKLLFEIYWEKLFFYFYATRPPSNHIETIQQDLLRHGQVITMGHPPKPTTELVNYFTQKSKIPIQVYEWKTRAIHGYWPAGVTGAMQAVYIRVHVSLQ